MTEFAAFDQLLAAPLRGDVAVWDEAAAFDLSAETFMRRMVFHGLAGLLNERKKLLVNWPAGLIEVIAEQARAQAFWELRHKALIGNVIEALAHEGIASVVLKGTALAYSYYDEPSHRARGDTDLLISENMLEAAGRILERLGWISLSTTHGYFGDKQYQDLWQYTDPAGLTHDLDLHWKLTNSILLNNILDSQKVMRDAAELQQLSASAFRPEAITLIVHGLINQALHANAGYYSVDREVYHPHRLAWAYDLTLVVSEFKDKDWQDLIIAIGDLGLSQACLGALDYACEMLDLSIPKDIRRQLAAAPCETAEARYINADRAFSRARADLRATRGFRRKFRLIFARALPDPGLLRNKYPAFEHWPIPFLYVKRCIDAFFAPSRKT